MKIQLYVIVIRLIGHIAVTGSFNSFWALGCLLGSILAWRIKEKVK